MTTNEVLTRQNFLTKLVLTNGNDELSKDLKVKVIKMRIEYGKVRKAFDADLEEFIKNLDQTRLRELQGIAEDARTEEEKVELQNLIDKINSDYNAYVISRGKDEVSVNTTSFTEDEFNELVVVNAGNDVEINGTKLSAADFLEILYTLFVEE
jgi:hypothetical protein